MSKQAVKKAATKHTATVIFLHGLGDTGNGWISTIASVCQPFVKIVCPTAPTMPVTLNGGYTMPAWFDISSLEPAADEDEEGIRAAAQSVHEILKSEESAGINSGRIVLGGFSMGGALALFSALTYQKKLGGIISLSGWLPLNKQFPHAARGNKDTPMLLCHGESDTIVAFKWGQMSAHFLKTFCSEIDFKSYKGLGHGHSKKVTEDFRVFLEKVQS